MSLTATCAQCHRQLWVDDVNEQWLTCPRCLHALRNPWYGRIAAEPVRPSPPENAASACVFCGEELKSHWRVCPQCNTPVRPPSRGTAGTSVDRDVSRDGKGSIVGLCVLVGMLLLGVILFLASGGMQLVTASPEGPAVFGIALLVVAAVVIGLGCLMYFSKSTTAKAVGGTLGGVVVGLTVALGFVLLLFFAICAGISNFLETCSKGLH